MVLQLHYTGWTVGEKIGRKRGMKFVGKIIEFENLPSILNAGTIDS